MAQSLNTTFVFEDNIRDSAFSKDSLVVSDSTRSLLTPLYASDYETDSRSSRTSSSSSSSLSSPFSSSNRDLSDGSSSTSYAKFDRRRTSKKATEHEELVKPKRNRGKWKVPLYVESCGNDNVIKNRKILSKSWEEWVIEKAVEDLKNLQIKKEIIQKKKLEKQQMLEDKRKKQRKEAENRERWLNEKNYELVKKIKEEAAQKEFENLKEKQKRELIESKSKIAYDKWLTKKEEMMKEQKCKEKQRKFESRERAIERQKVNEEAYKKWLRKNRMKIRTRKIYDEDPMFGLENYYKRITGASPSYVNPVPWRGVLDDTNKRTLSERFKERTEFRSPPLLWKEYDKRLGRNGLNAKETRASSSRMRTRP